MNFNQSSKEHFKSSKRFTQSVIISTCTYTCHKNHQFPGIQLLSLRCNSIHKVWIGAIETGLVLRWQAVVIFQDFVIHLLKASSVLSVQLDGFCKADIGVRCRLKKICLAARQHKTLFEDLVKNRSSVPLAFRKSVKGHKIWTKFPAEPLKTEVSCHRRRGTIKIPSA